MLSSYPLVPKENECPFCPHQVKPDLFLLEINPERGGGLGVGRKNPLEFASVVEKCGGWQLEKECWGALRHLFLMFHKGGLHLINWWALALK